MKPIKLCNVEFEVIYEDGTRKRVREGILFEVEENGSMTFHNGTDRKEVLFAVPEACAETICFMGLLEEYKAYKARTMEALKRAAARVAKRERRAKHEKNN